MVMCNKRENIVDTNYVNDIISWRTFDVTNKRYHKVNRFFRNINSCLRLLRLTKSLPFGNNVNINIKHSLTNNVLFLNY